MSFYDWWRRQKQKSDHYRSWDWANDRAYGDPMPEHIQRRMPDFHPPDTRHQVPRAEYSLHELMFPPDHEHEYYFWGGRWWPIADEMKHMFFLGTIGTGKSHLMLILLGQLARSIHPRSDRKMVVFAAKEDAVESLSGMGVPYTVINLNDANSPGWDIAQDYDSLNKAEELAALLLPHDQKGERFWVDGARAIVAGVIRSYIYRHGRHWTLGDVINGATSHVNTLIRILQQYPGNKRVIDTVLQEAAEKTAAGLRVQILSALARIIPFAAHSRQARRLLSIREFLKRESILVIEPDLDEREAINPFMQVFFMRLAEILSSLPDTDSRAPWGGRKVWVFLDEAQFIGKIPGITHFATFTRSKGGVLIMSAQTIDGLYHVYGREEAESILGTCESVTLLKSQNQVSAEWGVKKLGTVSLWTVTNQSSEGGRLESLSLSRSGRWETRHRLTTSDLQWLPPASRRDGVTGYFIPPHARDAMEVTLPADVIDHLRPERRRPPQRRQKTIDEYMLPPWTREEFIRFAFPVDERECELERVATEAMSHVMQDLLHEVLAPKRSGRRRGNKR